MPCMSPRGPSHSHNSVHALSGDAGRLLRTLCGHPDRSLGTRGNAEATRLFADEAGRRGWDVSVSGFACLRWERVGASLTLGQRRFGLHPGPYSPPAELEAPLRVLRSLDELQAVAGRGQILLMAGELAAEQLFPRGFPFYYPEEHEAIYAELDRLEPAALIAATGHNPEVAGGAYPFPLIEDGSFPFPSAYMTDQTGELLARQAVEGAAAEGAGSAGPAAAGPVQLRIRSDRVPATAEQVEAVRGPAGAPRILVTAHIDSKEGAPGAIDNAGGVVVLLLLAELLADYEGPYRLELIPFNGEDYYAVSGQLDWFRRNEDSVGDVRLAVNIDGVGYRRGATEYSFYGAGEETVRALQDAAARPGRGDPGNTSEVHGGGDFAAGEPWYQGDHAMFVQRGIPAVALTSERIWELSRTTTHSSRDVPEIVDPARLARTARVLGDFLRGLRT